MSYDLKSKLDMYKKAVPGIKIPEAGRAADEPRILKGRVCTNDEGTCYLVEKRYPVSYIHGGCAIGEALELNGACVKKLWKDLDLNPHISDFLFLDTETTGLSGGAGTVAFLVGAGFFEGDEFVLRQYLMRDYDEEPALLKELEGLFSRFKGLVTFNGKAFDWNLIQSRFTFNRMKHSLQNPIHLDLLYPSRRIWKLRLESCRLISLEENILGEYRTDDIPGAFIPYVFFKYLEDRDPSQLVKVVEHNEKDILSMTGLLVKMCTMLDNPLDETDREYELLGVGRIFENSGEGSRMVECYETCLDSADHFLKEMASKRLINAYKKKKDYGKLREHCETMLSAQGTRGVSTMVELAKYYEHREKNLEKAMEVVETALCKSMELGMDNSVYYSELKKRLNRLKRKAALRKESV